MERLRSWTKKKKKGEFWESFRSGGQNPGAAVIEKQNVFGEKKKKKTVRIKATRAPLLGRFTFLRPDFHSSAGGPCGHWKDPSPPNGCLKTNVEGGGGEPELRSFTILIEPGIWKRAGAKDLGAFLRAGPGGRSGGGKGGTRFFIIEKKKNKKTDFFTKNSRGWKALAGRVFFPVYRKAGGGAPPPAGGQMDLWLKKWFRGAAF